MTNVPFLRLTAGEQEAVVRLLQGAGIATTRVCVSRQELAGVGLPGGTITTVSTPRWTRSFSSEAGGDWVDDLRRALGRPLP